MVPTGSRGHEATIVSVDVRADGDERRARVDRPEDEATDCTESEAKPADPAWVGEEVAFVVVGRGQPHADGAASACGRRRTGRARG